MSEIKPAHEVVRVALRKLGEQKGRLPIPRVGHQVAGQVQQLGFREFGQVSRRRGRLRVLAEIRGTTGLAEALLRKGLPTLRGAGERQLASVARLLSRRFGDDEERLA